MRLDDQHAFDYHPALAKRLRRLAADAQSAPHHLEARIRETLIRESALREGRRRIHLFAGGGAGLVAATLVLLLLSGPITDPLAQPLAREARLGLARPVAVSSPDAEVLAGWLRSQLGYRVDVPTIAEAEVVGATVTDLDGVRGAAVVYRHVGGSLTYFALPPGAVMGRQIRGGVTAAAAGGFQIALWTEQGATRAVAASMPREAVLRVAEACRNEAVRRRSR